MPDIQISSEIVLVYGSNPFKIQRLNFEKWFEYEDKTCLVNLTYEASMINQNMEKVISIDPEK